MLISHTQSASMTQSGCGIFVGVCFVDVVVVVVVVVVFGVVILLLLLFSLFSWLGFSRRG